MLHWIVFFKFYSYSRSKIAAPIAIVEQPITVFGRLTMANRVVT